ncbi:EF-hand domain-containing protein [uncultured Cohaesibacter sp.]|uniref:EF-hand domain-containing protein n=1 Tax=uncultured Cohaesibacter sp. TaxID=1002546 RepID=UPI0029C64472|nr:EF-hand domain-containing protein [uncultured Cohaesibacter sp.]
MRNFLLFTTTSILIVLGIKVALANPAHHPDQVPQTMQGDIMSKGMMAKPMMSQTMMSQSMMGGGMMMNPDMMNVMLDTDGDGTLSLEEFQNLHQRMFAYMDQNKDGKLEASEFASHHASGMMMNNSKQN